jgi:hypothetical protein
MRLFVQRDAELFEEPHRLVNRQRSQHPRDDTRRPTVEVPRGHDAIRDITAPAPADENLGAKPPRAVDDRDRGSGCATGCGDCRHQASRARADHQDGLGAVSHLMTVAVDR